MQSPRGCNALGTMFYRNTIIRTFDELENFTSIRTLGSNCFRDCGLEHFIIPNSVTAINSAAIRNSHRLRYVILLQVPPSISANGDNFNNRETIYVPDELIDQYTAADIWQNLDIKGISEYEPIHVYECFEDGSLNQSGEVVESYSSVTTDYIPVRPEQMVRIFTSEGGTSSGRFVCCYDDSMNFIIWYNTYDNRRLTIPANTAYLRISFKWAHLDDCYLYNETTKEYLFKGIKVV